MAATESPPVSPLDKQVARVGSYARMVLAVAAVVMGAIDRVAIANMHVQAEERERRLAGERHLTAIPGGRASDGRMTAENTAIVLDSTADMPDPASEQPTWRSVPLTVRFGDEQFRDGIDIDAAGFYARLREGSAHPSTAAPSPGAARRSWPPPPHGRREQTELAARARSTSPESPHFVTSTVPVAVRPTRSGRYMSST